jgi:hypothetical protein
MSWRTCFKWFVSSVSLFARILGVLLCAQAAEEVSGKRTFIFQHPT